MVTEEELKDMSPEELMELQKKNCIFCQIVDGKVQSKIIHDDGICMAILDINPANPGHVLIIPKDHFAIMPQIEEDKLAHMFGVAQEISLTTLKTLKATGTNIFVANGTSAGQKAQHFMIHVIPRRDNDGIKAFDLPEIKMNDKELLEIQNKIINTNNASQPNSNSKKIDKPPEIEGVSLDDISDVL